MIESDMILVEPWAIAESALRLDLLAQTESIFALSNGHLGLRGNLDEGEPHVTPGTYLNGFFETLPLPYPEQGMAIPRRASRSSTSPTVSSSGSLSTTSHSMSGTGHWYATRVRSIYATAS